VDNGNQIRLAGEGQPGINGGPKGNLYILINVKSHKYFRRRERDILLDLEINVAQATLGADVPVPTVDGDAILKIPPATQPGKVLRMRGKGVPHLRGNGRGDQMVMVNVVRSETAGTWFSRMAQRGHQRVDFVLELGRSANQAAPFLFLS
jgi:molecular chaperone DnaJ